MGGLADAAPPTGRVYSGPDHLNIVSKSRGGLSSSKLHHISKMANEIIHNVKREREREREGWPMLSCQSWGVFWWIS